MENLMAETTFTLSPILPEPNNYFPSNIFLVMHHNDRPLGGQ